MSGPDVTVRIAIDGPSGSGKSSTSRGVARRLGLRYVDTGAMYRAMTWWILQEGIDPGDQASVALRCADVALSVTDDPDDPRVLVDGRDVTDEIRGSDVGAAVSRVSSVPEVRTRLVALQRALVSSAAAEGCGVVMEGRDIGTVVMPDADLKIFLTADAQARAQRRATEEAGGFVQPLDGAVVAATEEHLRSRDALDSTRSVSPLQPAQDAVGIDGTHLTLDEVIDRVVALAPESSG